MDHIRSKYICISRDHLKFQHTTMEWIFCELFSHHNRIFSTSYFQRRTPRRPNRRFHFHVKPLIAVLSHDFSTLTHVLYSRFSQHHYSGSFCSGSGALLQDLMTKASIRGNLTAFAPDAKVVRDQGIDYVLGETNSIACHVGYHTLNVNVRLNIAIGCSRCQ
jgi:hypothetical protein